MKFHQRKNLPILRLAPFVRGGTGGLIGIVPIAALIFIRCVVPMGK